jgi:hypothetical protein
MLLMIGLARSSGAYDEPGVLQDQRQAQRLLEQVPVSDLLGPLAPIALSPFFGMMCLSGITILVNQGVLPDNRFLTGNPVLNNPKVFWIFLFLTLLTSLPRLTKVSKPVAQLADMVETYSVIVILLVIHYVGLSADDSAAAGAWMNPAVSMAGLGSVTWGSLIAAVSIVNVIVIQTVRAFFEFAVWVSPIPLIDAIFEGLNKAVCAALMLLYAYSPVAAFALDVLLFLFCLMIFGWAHRRLRYFRHVMLGPVLAWLRRTALRRAPERFDPAAGLVVFPASRVGPIKTRACCRLRIDGERVVLRELRCWRAPRETAWPRAGLRLSVDEGLVAHAVVLREEAGEPVKLHWSRVHSADDIASWLGGAPRSTEV